MSGQALKTDPLCPQQHTHPKHSPNRCIFCEYGAAVRADALQAARDAVAAWLDKRKSHDFQTCDDYDHNCYLFRDAIAAIDALKGEQA